MASRDDNGVTAVNGKSLHKVPNLDRGLSVLELLSSRPEGLIASEIAEILEIPKNSLGRVLSALADRGFIDRDSESRKFTLTQKLLALGSSTVCEKDIVAESADVMRRLRDLTTETILLGVLLEGEGVILHQAPAMHQVRLMVDSGTRFELHCTSSGKVALAFLSEREADDIISKMKLPRHTDKTITRKDDLRRELEKIRKAGWAADRGEGIEGVNCVSAPIFDRTGHCVASLTITGPSSRMETGKLGKFAETTIEHARMISGRLGWEG
jgi:DNA-binding IclR family transcriptional regulator